MSYESRAKYAPFDYDCTGCVACCVGNNGGPDPTIYNMKIQAEVDNLPPFAQAEVVENGTSFVPFGFPLVEVGGGFLACSMLEGKVGQRATCRVQESKPFECWAFTPGSDNCIASRRKQFLPEESDPPLCCGMITEPYWRERELQWIPVLPKPPRLKYLGRQLISRLTTDTPIDWDETPTGDHHADHRQLADQERP